ncbi:hypothetical protein [Methanocella sp. MCL-LM]|uniref:hypothetical protein n=1 Tax=Methanocella sp. MCL-LM TaxID=3412035 RepID=UPI003C71661B
MTKIVHIYCPNCKTPMFSRDVDNVFLCDNCGTMHVRSNGNVETIGYEFGAFDLTVKGEGERVYLPFWVADVQFDIHDISAQGGGLGSLFGLLGGGQARNGTIVMYLPAYDMDPQHFKEVSMYHTGNHPQYKPAKPEPGVRRQKCTLTADLLPQMADFIFVTGIAEKPGTLQRLDYTLNVTGKRLIYLPHYSQGERYKPGY